ncbi:MAG: PAS domain S-box protein [Nitrospirota bacterium]|nr:PAS domain S-box protein [Nitrospirota bacterium]MDE3118210.1 PAS domain S-box protein [Nitrospirota bacterium]
MLMRKRRAELYAWLPGLIVIMTLLTLAVGTLALHHLESELVAFAGESLAIAATDIADKLDLLMFEHYSEAQILAGALDSAMHDHEHLTKHLSTWQHVHPAYLWIGVADAGGRLVAATDLQHVGQDRGKDRWFLAVKEKDDVLLEDAKPSPDAGGSVALSFTAPIKGADGKFLGAVSLRVGLPAMEGTFGRTVRLFQLERGLSGDVQWRLVAKDGTLLFDSLLGRSDRENLVQRGQPSALLLAATAPSGYVEEEQFPRRIKVVTGYARTEGYGRFPGLQWGVLVHVSRKDVLNPIYGVMGEVGVAGASVGIPLLALLFWTSLRLRKEWGRLLKHEAQLAATLASTADAVLVTDPAGLVTSVNRAAQALTGWRPEEVIGKRLQDVLTFRQGKSDQPLDSLIEPALHGTGHSLPPLMLVPKEGRDVMVEGSVSPIRDDGGKLVGAVMALRDITERIKVERRREAQYAVTKVLAEFPTLDEAAPHLLETICLGLDWPVGLLWTVDEVTNQLQFVEFWHTPADTVPTFESASRRTAFAPGIGLPGRVWASKKPAWISDVARDGNFPRAPMAEQARLHGAFAFPILSGERVLGVLEFFSHDVRQPDHDLLQMLQSIGSQIGHVLERHQLARQVRQAQAEGRG